MVTELSPKYSAFHHVLGMRRWLRVQKIKKKKEEGVREKMEKGKEGRIN